MSRLSTWNGSIVTDGFCVLPSASLHETRVCSWPPKIRRTGEDGAATAREDELTWVAG